MIKWWLQLWLVVLMFFLAPILVILAMPFMRPTDKVNILPSWLQWLNTYDDPGCDQGLYEPAVADKMKYGWYLKTLYWLGWRNQTYGLFYNLAPKIDPKVDALYELGTHGTGSWEFHLVTQDKKTYKEVGYTIGSHTLGYGYKLFSVDRFWHGTEYDGKSRPLFYLQLRKVK